jgi:hypothetical protein
VRIKFDYISAEKPASARIFLEAATHEDHSLRAEMSADLLRAKPHEEFAGPKSDGMASAMPSHCPLSLFLLLPRLAPQQQEEVFKDLDRQKNNSYFVGR